MTVIVTLIGRDCTVHATDSLITQMQPDGTREVIEAVQPKMRPVRHFRGAISYWGLACVNSQWSTVDWLDKHIPAACRFDEPERFVEHLTDILNQDLEHLHVQGELNKGIGFHFTAYEYVDGYWIPELFSFSNYADPTYSALHSQGVVWSRQAFNTAYGGQHQRVHREQSYRMRVRDFLNANGYLIFNNGDPFMFNVAAASLQSQLRKALERKVAKQLENASEYRRFARFPIEIVANMQREFYLSGQSVVGGKIHDLSITSSGEYESDSGDAP
ncbi:MAG: hypothetical protein K8S97_06335 [Anaerolineae bacterium]|nr:hypothetical protein [Anaerolineae bacterium]